MFESKNWLFFALGSAFFAGLTTILAKVGVSGVNSNLATFIRTLVILGCCGALVSWRGEWTGFGTIGASVWVLLALSGIATAASWLCYFRALQMAPASSVAPVDKLSVVVTMGLAFVFLGESASPRLLAGAALIVGGTILIATGK